MYNEFAKDLKDGELAEAEVMTKLLPHFERAGYLVVEDKAKKTHDLKFVHPSEQAFLVEVKWDQYSKKSGNIAIEFECSGKPSGILTTTARVWVYKYWEKGQDDWQYRAIPTDELKGFINETNYRIVAGGDQLRARMVLVPVKDIESLGVKL
jgi:hypothetical protein